MKRSGLRAAPSLTVSPDQKKKKKSWGGTTERSNVLACEKRFDFSLKDAQYFGLWMEEPPWFGVTWWYVGCHPRVFGVHNSSFLFWVIYL